MDTLQRSFYRLWIMVTVDWEWGIVSKDAGREGGIGKENTVGKEDNTIFWVTFYYPSGSKILDFFFLYSNETTDLCLLQSFHDSCDSQSEETAACMWEWTFVIWIIALGDGITRLTFFLQETLFLSLCIFFSLTKLPFYFKIIKSQFLSV